MNNELLKQLKELSDKKYAMFQAKLLPTIDKSTIIGVRTNDLRSIAKQMIKENNYKEFLDEAPHKLFDENQLHIFILSEIKNYDECIKEVNKFLPYIDNWATCDQLSPKIFNKNKTLLLKEIKKWIKSKHSYTVRFGICCLMSYYLDSDFCDEYIDMVAKIKYKNVKYDDNISIEDDADKYYVEMMRAWYFATALAKQYKNAIKVIKNNLLNKWTHNKTIRKALESYRVSDIHKNELRKFLIKT